MTGLMSAKVTYSKVLNLLLWLVGSALASTGFILAFRLLSGRDHRGTTLWGMDRHTWGDIHTWLAYILMALVALHLLIHLRWLWVVACKRDLKKLLVGVLIGFALPVIALLWPVELNEELSGPGFRNQIKG